MVKSEPNVLILTLYSGENELDDAIAALKTQTWSRWEHRIFRDLPNVEAHQALYDCIMNARDEFALFVKLDGDMVLTRTSALADVVHEFVLHEELDHAVFSVRDWASQQDIMGMHVYSNRVTWSHTDEALFVDPAPVVPGERRLYWQAPAPVADHMPNPSLEQAWLFGYHRALKIVQRGRLRKNAEQARIQFLLLQGVWEAYKSSLEPRRAAILLGAEQAFAGKDRALTDKRSVCVTREWKDFQQQHHVDDRLTKCWEPGHFINRWRYWRWVQLPGWLMRLVSTVRPGHTGRGVAG